MRNRRPRKGFIATYLPRIKQELMALLTKIIGETLKDKVVRAVIVGVVSAGGSYSESPKEVPPDPKPPMAMPARNDKTPE